MLDREVFNEVKDVLIEHIGESDYELGFSHQGYKLNPDMGYVRNIVKGIISKGGYCPCRVQKVEENMCCCKDFIENGHCCCKLWVKEEE